MSRSSNEDVYVGKYKLMKTIGKGNFAKVKLAKHMPTGQEVRRNVCVCVCVCARVCVHMCACVNVSYVSASVCFYVCACLSVCVCWFYNNILFMSSCWFITQITPLPPSLITCSHSYLTTLFRLPSR